MVAYRRVYDSRHLQADCQEPPESATEPPVGILAYDIPERNSSML